MKWLIFGLLTLAYCSQALAEERMLLPVMWKLLNDGYELKGMVVLPGQTTTAFFLQKMSTLSTAWTGVNLVATRNDGVSLSVARRVPLYARRTSTT